MTDAIDELIEHRRQYGTLSAGLLRAYKFHRANPQVLDFLVRELWDARASGWKRASLGSLWHHARWTLLGKRRIAGESFVMPNNLIPWFERIIVILHPDLNGFFAMAKSQADADFGTMLEPVLRGAKRGYIRRLRWADGNSIEKGWRPATPHEPKMVKRRERVRQYAP